MNLLSKIAKIALLFLGLSLAPLIAAQSPAPVNSTSIDIESFRDKVVAAAKAEGANSSFVLDPDDPYHMTITHDGSSADLYLENVFNYFLAYPEEDGLDGTIETVTFLIHSFEKNKLEVTIDINHVVAVIRDDSYIEQVKNYSDDAAHQIFTRKIAGDLNAYLMVDSPETLAGLNRSDVTDISDETLWETALDNVRPYLSKIAMDDQLGHLRLYYVDGNTFLTPSLILLDEFWEAVSTDYPEGLLFALPRKDQLFTVDAAHPNAYAMIRTMVSITFEENVNLLSSEVYHYDAGEIKLFTP